MSTNRSAPEDERERSLQEQRLLQEERAMAAATTGRVVTTLWWTLFWLAVGGVVSWPLDLDDLVCASIAAGHLPDWARVGGLCLVWLILILKAPWDLYFHQPYRSPGSHQRNPVPGAPGRPIVPDLRRELTDD